MRAPQLVFGLQGLGRSMAGAIGAAVALLAVAPLLVPVALLALIPGWLAADLASAATIAGRSVLLISHRFSTVRSADRIYRHRDVAHQPAEFYGQPVQRRDDHLLETAGLDLDHEPIVQRAAGLTTGSRREWR